MEKKIIEFLKKEGWFFKEWNDTEGLIGNLKNNIIGIEPNQIYKIWLGDSEGNINPYESQFGWWAIRVAIEDVDGQRYPGQLIFDDEDEYGEINYYSLRVGEENIIK